MGLFDKTTSNSSGSTSNDVPDDVVTKLVSQLLSVGIDGVGPVKPAKESADKALHKANGNVEKAVKDLVSDHVKAATAGGFVTGLGGFITLPVALPANVLEFYVLATRMTAGVAHLRGYNLAEPSVRAAVLLALTGNQADEVLSKVGLGGAMGGSITKLALSKLPAAALMVVNKAVGFQIVKSSTSKLLVKLGKGVPVAGGVVGGGLDAWMMQRIGSHARKEFPRQ
ncbi:EcsC family protein [Propionibacteriaceae bacterium G1746]|uniref:EcsC family protein n=1 Tax=Aestuariimicrobium sp. G57 TaxID=3418485 RepID=UPI003C29E33D